MAAVAAIPSGSLYIWITFISARRMNKELDALWPCSSVSGALLNAAVTCILGPSHRFYWHSLFPIYVQYTYDGLFAIRLFGHKHERKWIFHHPHCSAQPSHTHTTWLLVWGVTDFAIGNVRLSIIFLVRSLDGEYETRYERMDVPSQWCAVCGEVFCAQHPNDKNGTSDWLKCA